MGQANVIFALDYDFSSVLSGATIDGIKVNISGYAPSVLGTIDSFLIEV